MMNNLSKRDFFAAVAMLGLCRGAWNEEIQDQAESLGSTSSIAIAVYAVDLADALIAELDKPVNQ